jgi:hypothetical protein
MPNNDCANVKKLVLLDSVDSKFAHLWSRGCKTPLDVSSDVLV